MRSMRSMRSGLAEARLERLVKQEAMLEHDLERLAESVERPAHCDVDGGPVEAVTDELRVQLARRKVRVEGTGDRRDLFRESLTDDEPRFTDVLADREHFEQQNARQTR